MARLKRGDMQVNGTQTGRAETDTPNTVEEPSKRAELLAILAEADAGLSKKDIENGTFLNFNWKNGELYTFNDEVGVRVKLPSWWIVPEGSVPGAKLKEVLAKITDDNIQVHEMPRGTQGEAAELIIIGQSAKAGIAMHPDVPDSEKWFGPRAADMMEDQYKTPIAVPADMMAALRTCATSVSTNMTNYWMINVFLHGNTVFACDGFRATDMKLQELATDSMLAIPHLAIPAILNFGAQSYTYNSKWLVLFKSKAQMFVKLTGKFDDAVYNQIKAISDAMYDDTDFAGLSPITFPEGFESLVDKATAFTAGEAPIDRHIAIHFDQDIVTVRSEQQGVGWIEGSMPLPGNGQVFTMIVSPTMLMEALAASRDILVDAQTRKCKFVGTNFIHTMMLFVE